MRISTVLAASTLALGATAQEQIPLADRLKGWYAEAQSYLSDAAAAAASHLPTADAGAARVAEHNVHHVTLQNWESTLRHTGTQTPYHSPEAWLLYFTGGNKTCHGRCHRADVAWNESVALFASDVSAPRLAQADCDAQEVLCGAFAAHVPSLWVLLLPEPGSAGADKTPIKIFALNSTTVTAADITKVHTRKLYLQEPDYEGVLHPFDGWVARLGLLLPMAYLLWGFGKIPSWAMMVGISMFSRSFASRRMPQAQGGARPAGGAAAPART